MVFICKVMLIQ